MSPTQSLFEFDTYQDMANAANQAAVNTFGNAVSGVFYRQGGRRFVSATLPVPILLKFGKRDSTAPKGDPSEARNRPLDQSHVREIAQYLTEEDEYLIPPIILNASQELQIFVYRVPVATKPCVFVLPTDEYLYVTDGQHRLEALRRAVEARPELRHDAVGVTIIEESDMDKVHQDFFDAAQVKPLAKALLVEYDGREPVNAMAREVTTRATVFKGRIERIGNVGKNSLMLFTNNQIKQAILQLVVGDWSIYGNQMLKQAVEAISPAKDLWSNRVCTFFEEFTQANDQWREVAERPLESGLTTNVPGLRQDYLHFTGGGLLVLCGVGHAILDLANLPGGELSEEQRQQIRMLAQLDWSRDAAMWSGQCRRSTGQGHSPQVECGLGGRTRQGKPWAAGNGEGDRRPRTRPGLCCPAGRGGC